MISRSKISWSELTGASVGVWGLGVEGGANLRKLLALGVTPVIADDRPKQEEVDGISILSTAAGGWEALARCEVVVKTPGISRYRPDVAALEASGVAVVGGLGLWLEETDRDRVVCITGTKGKSTTTSILGHLLSELGHRCLVGGNIGSLPYDPALRDDFEFTALEVSSFQATDLSCAPPVVAVTSLHPDHLDWHGSLERYYADKLSICAQPGAVLTIANGDSSELRGEEAQLSENVQWVHDGPARWAAPLGLLGAHNRRNARIARACIAALGIAQPEDALEQAAQGFKPLESRLSVIGQFGGVHFVDDSLATNALATMAALDAFSGDPVVLIVGGADRGIDYTPLAEHIVSRTDPTFVVTLPASGSRIHGVLAEATKRRGIETIKVYDSGDLNAAVTKALEWATPGTTVLLSPAAASFGQFRNYKERAQAFRAAVEAAHAC